MQENSSSYYGSTWAQSLIDPPAQDVIQREELFLAFAERAVVAARVYRARMVERTGR